MEFFVYMVRCKDGTLYTGYTNDLEARVRTHNGETNAVGAKYTRGRRPVQLVYTETCTSRSAALTRERQIKALTRSEKEALIENA